MTNVSSNKHCSFTWRIKNDGTKATQREHIQTVLFNGIPVVTLDVDGMWQTKQTTRESDIPDRLKLERLKNAIRELARK